MSVVRSLKVICLIVPLVLFADCGGMYGDFLNDPDNAGVAQWATPMKTAPGQCSFKAVAEDNDGNSYAVGSVSGSGPIDFGGNSKEFKVENGSNDNAVIVKYDASGVAQWALPIEESSSGSCFNDIAVDDSGNAYAVGSTHGEGWYNFGGKSSRFYCNINLFHIVIVKYNTSGVVQWANPVVTGQFGCVFSGIAVDKVGNSYAVGYIDGKTKYEFGGTNGGVEGINGYRNAVVVKYNSSGVAQWARTVVASSNKNEFSGVAVDEDGNAYAVGKIIDGGSFSFVEGSIGCSGKFAGENAIIVKYNTDGIAQWENTVESASGQTMFYKVAADREGNAYAAGYVDKNGSFNFGGRSDPFHDKGSEFHNSVIVKYSASGIAQWAVPIEFSQGPSEFQSVAVDILGNVYAAGNASYSGSGIDFGGNSLPFSFAADTYEGVIVKYTSEGFPQWATSVKSDMGGSAFYGVAVDRYGYTYVAGFDENRNQYDFGGKSTPVYGAGNGDFNTVIVKYY